jgi:hypothetical protein
MIDIKYIVGPDQVDFHFNDIFTSNVYIRGKVRLELLVKKLLPSGGYSVPLQMFLQFEKKNMPAS